MALKVKSLPIAMMTRNPHLADAVEATERGLCASRGKDFEYSCDSHVSEGLSGIRALAEDGRPKLTISMRELH
jgi:hypothetical protein